MAALTNYLENKLVDLLWRATSYVAPSWYLALFTAAPSDTGGGTEVSGGSYARILLNNTTSIWAATNSAGSTAATSSGTSGTTSNNNTVTFAAPTATWGTITHFGFYDASTGGNLLVYGAFAASKLVSNGDPALAIAPGSLTIQLDGSSGMLTDYTENKLIDYLFRSGSITSVFTNNYVGLLTAAPSDTGGGTEVSGGSYARVNLASSTTNWAGTQSAGSTTASSGTGGTTSNNSAITFAAPTANWGTVTHVGVYDAPSAGNLLYWGALTSSLVVNNGDPAPQFPAASLTLQIDN